MCSTGGAGGAAAAVAAAVEALAAADPADLPEAGLGAELVGLRAQLDRLEAQWLRRLRTFDARGGGAGQGYLSTRSWLAGECRLAAGAAGEALRVARSLHPGPGGTPAVGAALETGEISYPHARVLTRELAALAGRVDPGVVARAEATLVDTARVLDPLSTRAAAVHLRHVLDAEGVAAEEHEASGGGPVAHLPALGWPARARRDRRRGGRRGHPHRAAPAGHPRAPGTGARPPSGCWPPWSRCAGAPSTPASCPPPAGSART